MKAEDLFSKLSIINFVDIDSSAKLNTILKGNEYLTIAIDTKGAQSKEEILNTFSEQIFKDIQLTGWDHLAELLDELVWTTGSTKICLLWMNMDSVLLGGMKNYTVLYDIFSQLSKDCYKENIVFTTFAFGKGEDFIHIDV